jgi:hypothetical protein
MGFYQSTGSTAMRIWQRMLLVSHRAKRWLQLGLPLWKLIGTVGLILIAPQLVVHHISYPANWRDAVRVSGVMLQTLGILTVVWDLSGVARDLDAPPVWRGVVLFVKAFANIFRGPEVVSAVGTITGASVIAAAGSFTVHEESHGSLEDRVKNLEARLRAQDQEVVALKQSVDSHVESLKGQINQEANERKAGDAESAERIKNAVLGAMHIKLSGIAYLILGTICTSLPLTIAT